MELTDIQNDSDLKRAFSEQDLLSFDTVVKVRGSGAHPAPI